MSVRALLAFPLLALAFGAQAREARLAGPGGEGGCSADYASAATPDVDPVRASRRPEADKPVVPRGAGAGAGAGTGSSGSETGARPPRWHSFLPGMFR